MIGPLFVALVLGLMTWYLWLNRLPPFDGLPEPEPVTLQEVTAAHDGVRVEGTAHFPVRIRYVEPARIGRPEQTRFLFPMLPLRDTSGRRVRVMISSAREPDPVVSYADLTVDGFARPGGAFLSGAAVDALRRAGYTLEDDLVVIEEYPPPAGRPEPAPAAP
jgi:hypothetical protein